MSITSFISGSDNIYKYFATLGLVLILGAVVYPFEKAQTLSKELIEFEKKSDLLKVEMREALSKINSFEEIRKEHDSLESLVANKKANDKILIQISTLKNRMREINVEAHAAAKEVEVLNADHQYHSKFVLALSKTRDIYNIAALFVSLIGIFSMLYGFSRWLSITKKQEKRDDKAEMAGL